MTKTTKDGLTIYDLQPQASELCVVAGPIGYSVDELDMDALPEGFRWVTAKEWEELQAEDEPKLKTITVHWEDGKLCARCDEDHTLNSHVVPWDPIAESSDSHAIAIAVTEINGAEIYAVDHDGGFVHVHVLA
jgi:hypothetical protein